MIHLHWSNVEANGQDELLACWLFKLVLLGFALSCSALSTWKCDDRCRIGASFSARVVLCAVPLFVDVWLSGCMWHHKIKRFATSLVNFWWFQEIWYIFNGTYFY
jgi:hypothetical protein